MRPMKINASCAQDYYIQKDPVFTSNSVWIGAGAELIGLRGEVDLEKFNNLLFGLDPQGQRRLVGRESGPQAHHLNSCTDIPLSCPKSFSIAALFDPQIRESFQRAAINTAETIEMRHILGRQTILGATEMVPGKMIASLFYHSTSRADDAHFHAHLLIQNIVLRPDGTFSTMENRQLFHNQREITQIFYSNLAKEVEAIGYNIELREGKAGQIIPELACYRNEVNDLFAKRHHTIQGAELLRADLHERIPRLQNQAIESLVQLQTKTEKDSELTHDSLLRNHTEQLSSIGIDVREYLSQLKETGQIMSDEQVQFSIGNSEIDIEVINAGDCKSTSRVNPGNNELPLKMDNNLDSIYATQLEELKAQSAMLAEKPLSEQRVENGALITPGGERQDDRLDQEMTLGLE